MMFIVSILLVAAGLGQTPTAKDVPQLLQALNNPDPSVRGAVEMKLVSLHDPEAFPLLLDAVTRDSQHRNVLIRALANYHDARKIPVYVRLARAGERSFPAWSDALIVQLKEFGPPAAQALMDSFESPCEELYVEWVGSALAEFEDAGVPIALQGLATEGDECRQMAGDYALNNFYLPGRETSSEESDGVPVLTTAARSESHAVRLVAQGWIQNNIEQPSGKLDFRTILDPLLQTYHRAQRASTKVGVLDALEAFPAADTEITKVITEAAHDPDSSVRAVAEKWLSENQPPPQSAPPKTPHTAEEKIAVLKDLGAKEDAGDTAEVAIYFADPDPRVRTAAADAMSLINATPTDMHGHDERERDYEGANKALAGALHDPDPTVRTAMVNAIGEVNNVAFGSGSENDMTEKLAALVTDSSPAVLAALAEALGKIGDPAGVPTLLRLAPNDNADVRRASAQALVRFDQPDVTCAKVARLRDADQGVRYFAAEGLFEAFKDGTRCPNDVDSLIAGLRDPQEREWVRLPLGQLKDKRAVGPLIEDLKTRGEPSSTYCHDCIALADIRDPAAIEPALPLLQSQNPVVASGVASMLSSFNDPRAIRALTDLMKDSRAEMRANAIAGLSRLRQCQLAPEFRHALTDEGPGVREKAAVAAAVCRDKEAVDALIALLPFQPVAAANALAQIGDTRAVPGLIKVLNDRKVYGRVAVVKALGELHDLRAVDPLIAALHDDTTTSERYSIIIEAAKALGCLGDPRAIGPLQALVAAAHRMGTDLAADAATQSLKTLGATVPERKGQ